MSLIIATGSNIGERQKNLFLALDHLKKELNFIAASSIFESPAVEYTQQPDFYNQVLEFSLPQKSPNLVMQDLLALEKKLGRQRDIPKGPRVIDIDIIFWGTQKINLKHLITPHPRWHERSFVVQPLKQLPFYQEIKKHYHIPTSFDHTAKQVD